MTRPPDALLDLRDSMVAQGAPSRFGLTFTIGRSGQFDLAVTYEMPEDFPWIDSLRYDERHGTP